MTLHVPQVGPDDDIITAAIAYATAGWYLIPIKHGSKHPGSVVGFSWNDKSSRDPEVLAAWLAGTNNGIALHVGRSGAVAFDVDRPDNLPPVLEQAIATYCPPTQTTREGGDPRRGHYLFAQPPGRTLGNGTGRLGGTWGEIRGLNGIIVVAPSVHEDAANGGRYAWAQTGPVPVLPPDLADLLEDASQAEDSATDAAVAAFLTSHQESRRPQLLDGWLATYTHRIASGESRHDRMVSVLTGALKEAAAGYFPATEAAAQLRKVFLDAVSKPPRGQQGKPRTGKEAESEWSGILSWAVAQATAADVADVHARVAEKAPDSARDLAALIGSPTPQPPPRAALTDGSAALAPATSSTPAPVEAETVVEQDGDAPPLELPPSWQRVDLSAYLDGTYVPEQATLYPRTDGACLLYPGRTHSFHGESESGKSLVAQAEAARVLSAGGTVLYVDWESDAAAVTGRLLELGATADAIRDRLDYRRPENSPLALRELEEWRSILAGAYTLAVLDGVTDALGTFGASTTNNDEIAEWMRTVPRQIAARTGAAVIQIDHVTKDADTRGRYALGGQAKMNALDGAAYVVEIAEPIGRGMKGTVVLRVAKDRPGTVRPSCGRWRASDRSQEAARITVDSTGDDGRIAVTVGPPRGSTDDTSENAGRPFRPTGIMEKVSRLLEAAGEQMTRSAVLKTLKEDGVKARPQTVYDAINYLVEGGYVASESAPNGRPQPVRHVTPYRQKNDPQADAFDPLTAPPVPTSSDRFPTGSRKGSRPVPGTAPPYTGRELVDGAAEPPTSSQTTDLPIWGHCKTCGAEVPTYLVDIGQATCPHCRQVYR